MEEIKVYNDKKFKSIYLSCNYLMNISKEEYAKYSLLTFLMAKSCKKYKTNKEIERYLAENYGSKIDVDVQKIGELYNLEFRMEFLSDKCLKNEELFIKMLSFMNEIIYNPNVHNGLFDDTMFKREKEALIDKIKARKDEKLRYGVSRITEVLCEHENYGGYVYGNLEEAEKLTNKEIFEAYQNVINNSFLTIVIAGDFESCAEEEVKTRVKENIKFKKNNIDINEIRKELTNEFKEHNLREVNEKEKSAQAVIGIGMRLNISKEEKIAAEIYNEILGGTPSSKLFQNVREKNSLAYTTRSIYHKMKDIIIAYAGIEEKNFGKAKEIMLQEIEKIKNGDITKAEINCAKEAITSKLKEGTDSKIFMCKKEYLDYLNDDNLDIQSIITNLNKVTKEDIINIASKVKVELIYLLGGGKSEK